MNYEVYLTGSMENRQIAYDKYGKSNFPYRTDSELCAAQMLHRLDADGVFANMRSDKEIPNDR